MQHGVFGRREGGSRRIGLTWLGLLVLATACGEGAPGTAPPPPPPPPPAVDLADGQHLFDQETFGGNGRTCLTCHMRETGTIILADISRRLAANPDDELFRHDALDDGHLGTSRILTHGTIRVELPLPPYVTLVDNPAQRTIVVHRGVPTTLNSPALDGRGVVALMLDLREADLQRQALGAIRTHAQSPLEPTRQQLDNLAAFQQMDERFFSSAVLRAFARGGPPPQLPEGSTDSERRGRTFFVDAVPAPGSKEGVCGMCHSGPMLNEVNQFGQTETGVPIGAKIGNVLVAETNKLRNPTFAFAVDGPGGSRRVNLPDPGIMLTPPGATPQMSTFVLPFNLHPEELAGFFKTPSLWGVRHTAPYFHDNSAKTLRELVDHYGDVFFRDFRISGRSIELTEQDRRDIVDFLERL
jgi:cytochrome c553